MYKYSPINNELFKLNRANFVKQLKADSIAIFNSNDEHPWNGDATHKFKQNSDIFYLSGIDQEESILVIYPDSPTPELREALFIKQTSDLMVTWNGYKLTQAQAQEVSGIANLFWLDDFEAKIRQAINYAQNIYLSFN
ncbi:MAG: aminopeptidase P N-terminal domain-containing protein [Candidatus Methylacidiphilales bacterium]